MRLPCRRCDYLASDLGDAATHAAEAAHWLCDCGRSLTPEEPRTCELCLTDFRRTLADILVLWQELPRHLRTVPGTALGGARGGDDGPPLPGGAALALLGPGSPGTSARRLTRTDKEREVDGREHAVDNLSTDTPSVAWVLGQWEDDWRHTRGDDPAMTGTSTGSIIQGAARYLEVHARWAANNHEAFADCATELRDLRTTLEAATHRLRRPAKANADCFACGGDLIRRVVDGLEEDAVTCRDCREQYDPARYSLALSEQAWAASRVDLDGEPWATVERAAHDSGSKIGTVRVWMHRELVRSRVYRGVVLVAEADVTARARRSA